MQEALPKEVLASISKLKGATADEVAADLGVDTEAVLPTLADLAAHGYVRPIGRGVPVTPAGRVRVEPDELKDVVLDVTTRGVLEMRS